MKFDAITAASTSGRCVARAVMGGYIGERARPRQ
jgi:hypothetical protein